MEQVDLRSTYFKRKMNRKSPFFCSLLFLSCTVRISMSKVHISMSNVYSKTRVISLCRALSYSDIYAMMHHSLRPTFIFSGLVHETWPVSGKAEGGALQLLVPRHALSALHQGGRWPHDGRPSLQPGMGIIKTTWMEMSFLGTEIALQISYYLRQKYCRIFYAHLKTRIYLECDIS